MGTKSTIKDVAKAAGVSVGTVSRVVNSHPSVDPATRQRVIRVMADLGYEPNAVAQSMRTQVTRIVGFVVPDISNPLWARILRAASQIFHAQGYSVIVASTDGLRSAEIEVLATVTRRRMDALMLALNSPNDAALQRSLARLNTPVAVMERDLGEQWDTVITDHGGGAYAATRYLTGLGHRRIALLTAAADVRPSRERILGYKRALAEAGIALEPELVRSGSFDREFGFSEASRVLSWPEPPTAIVAGGNQLLPGVLQAALIQGLTIPQQLSVVSCGDTDLAQLARPAITVVRWNAEAVGVVAAETLLRHLSGTADSKPSWVILPTELILRDSCAPPAARRRR